MTAPLTRQQVDEHNHALAVMRSNGQRTPTWEELVAQHEAALDGLDRAIAERDRQAIRCAVTGPHSRRMDLNQRDAAHLPLFVAANEPRMI